MPNWCNNKLEVKNCSSELEQYLNENGLSFERIKPTPPHLLTDENSSWYGWRVSNWGTKWDLTEEEQRFIADALVSENAGFSACFDTAWAPPTQAIAALSAAFPDDNFVLHYIELGCGFGGTAYISNGESVESDVFEDTESLHDFARNVFDYDPDECED